VCVVLATGYRLGAHTLESPYVLSAMRGLDW